MQAHIFEIFSNISQINIGKYKLHGFFYSSVQNNIK